MNKKNFKLIISKSRTGWFFVLPSLIFFAIFTFYPIIMGFWYSFTDFKGISNHMEFIGLDNYKHLFKDRYFLVSLKNNVIYAILFSFFTLVIALILASILDKIAHLKDYFRISFFLPYITSMVSVAIIWKMILNPFGGPLNQALISLGIDNPPKWLASSKSALYAIILVSVWKSCGYYMLIFLAGLQNIPKTLYEAASIDGSSKLHSYFKITLPLLSPTIFFNSVLVTINSFMVFDLINVMTQGGPGKSTNVLAFRIYIEAFKYGKMGYGSAIAYFLFFTVMILTAIQFRYQKKWVYYA